jgi:type I restriction enzyme M protein
MDQATHNKIVSFIWGIADDVLRDLFKRGKYPDVILPMCVIRRMDAVLEPTKNAVLDTKKMLDDARITEQRAALAEAAGQAFYNTGIATYIWVLSNKKPAHRQGPVQLIDASQWFKPLRKNLGKKNCELSPEDIERISRTFLDFKETPESKIFPNAAFGYWKVTVEQPLRLHSQLSLKAIETLRFASGDEDLRAALYEEFGDDLFTKLRTVLGNKLFEDHNIFRDRVDAALKKADLKLAAADLKQILKAVSWRVETAAPVIAKVHKPGKTKADPLRGKFEVGRRQPSPLTLHTSSIVEYEPGSDLRDTEQVPLLEEGGIEAFIRREVLPYTPDAWIKEDATKIGYEVSFTRHFYKPQPLRTLEEIRADILAIEQEAEGLLDDLLK